MKALVLIALFFCFKPTFGQISAPGQPVPMPAPERYICYKNIPEIRLLFDTVEVYSFLNLLNKTIAQAAVISNIYLGGISREDILKLRKIYPQGIPDLEYRLEPQPIIPLRSKSGQDSIFYLNDGTPEFVYPARDTTFFINQLPDEIILREAELTDSIGNKTFLPLEIILRHQFPGDQTIITCQITFDLLQLLNKGFFIPVETTKGQALMKETEDFLKHSVKKLGGSGCYELIDERGIYRFQTQRNTINGLSRSRRNRATIFAECMDIVRDDKTVGCSVYLRETKRRLLNKLGRDSVRFDASGKVFFVEGIVFDTTFYVSKGFEGVYNFIILTRDEASGVWKEELVNIVLKKTILPGEPLVVYTAEKSILDDNPSWRTGYRYEDPIYKRNLLNVESNPLYLEMAKWKPQTWKQFPWEKTLLDNTLEGTILNSL